MSLNIFILPCKKPIQIVFLFLPFLLIIPIFEKKKQKKTIVSQKKRRRRKQAYMGPKFKIGLCGLKEDFRDFLKTPQSSTSLKDDP